MPYRTEEIGLCTFSSSGAHEYTGWRFSGFCVHCQTKTHHIAEALTSYGSEVPSEESQRWPRITAVRNRCVFCGRNTYDIAELHEGSNSYSFSRVYPATFEQNLPPPHPDTPEECLKVYNEASAVFAHSARAAGALMRLAVELLCNHLKAKGDKLHEKILFLKNEGMSNEVFELLSFVRIAGNGAVHETKMIVDDSPEIGRKLFQAFNAVVSETVSRRKLADEAMSLIPESQRNRIKQALPTPEQEA